MPNVKRIAMFLDGTWNTVAANTNVWRLRSLCEETPEQLVYYSAGVGTLSGEHVSGGMFGIGIDKEVTDAYEWLIEHYEPGAQLFIFGFSRGAFTARSLAGFVAKCGLLQAGSPVSLNQMFERYRKGTAISILKLANIPENELDQEDRLIKVYSQPIPVWFQGVWDTVGSLGVPLPFFPKVGKEDFTFLETDLRISQTHAYHALAIDEHREAFAPTLWLKKTPKQGECPPARELDHVEQRWFVGAHANVGGGYEDDLLAEVPLIWLMNKAIKHGLHVKHAAVLDGNVYACAVRDSYAEMAHGAYEAITFWHKYYRTIGGAPVDSTEAVTSTINETIDASVFERWRVNKDYRPQNLSEWGERHKIDPATLKCAVHAKDGQILDEDVPTQ